MLFGVWGMRRFRQALPVARTKIHDFAPVFLSSWVISLSLVLSPISYIAASPVA